MLTPIKQKSLLSIGFVQNEVGAVLTHFLVVKGIDDAMEGLGQRDEDDAGCPVCADLLLPFSKFSLPSNILSEVLSRFSIPTQSFKVKCARCNLEAA
jgi:hypothetical protein